MPETEVRVPCERLDRALAAVRDPDVGRPDYCERFVERIALVLESHGLGHVSAREFVKRYDVERRVRAMVIYAGWIEDPEAEGGIALAVAHAAAIHPKRGFPERRKQALDAVYRAMELGPYAKGEASPRPD